MRLIVPDPAVAKGSQTLTEFSAGTGIQRGGSGAESGCGRGADETMDILRARILIAGQGQAAEPVWLILWRLSQIGGFLRPAVPMHSREPPSQLFREFCIFKVRRKSAANLLNIPGNAANAIGYISVFAYS